MRWGSIVRNWLSPPTIVLAYHRVADLTTDPWGLAVSPQNFAAQMEVLRHHHSPVSLSSLVDYRRRRTPRDAVAVTFDDGYADNLVTAGPLLERSQVPATFFVAVDGINARTEFWWDALERIILQTESLPSQLTLATESGPSEWSTGEDQESASSDSGRADDPGAMGRFGDRVSPARIRLYYRLWELLFGVHPAERERLVQQLHEWADVPLEARESHRTLTLDELRQLNRGVQFSIGAHAVTHTPLTKLDEVPQRLELEQGKEFLEELFGSQPFGFAYPHGDHDEKLRQLVADSGYAFACTTQPGAVWPSTPRFQLPRCTVMDWSGDEFAAQLRKWQHTLPE